MVNNLKSKCSNDSEEPWVMQERGNLMCVAGGEPRTTWADVGQAGSLLLEKAGCCPPSPEIQGLLEMIFRVREHNQKFQKSVGCLQVSPKVTWAQSAILPFSDLKIMPFLVKPRLSEGKSKSRTRFIRNIKIHMICLFYIIWQCILHKELFSPLKWIHMKEILTGKWLEN